MADLFPSFARKREAHNFAEQTRALDALRRAVGTLDAEAQERFQCLVADVARTVAWSAGRRDWLSLLEATTRSQGEDFPVAIRKMGLAESLETSLWLTMRAHPQPVARLALGLVAVRLRLGVAWVHERVLAARDLAGAMILDAFETAELSPSAVAELSADDFRVGAWPETGDLFAKLEEVVFDRGMDRFGPLTAPLAPNQPFRDAFEIDPPAAGRAGSPCYDLALRNTKETGPKGVRAEAAKLFGAEIAEETLRRKGVDVDGRTLVSLPEVLTLAATLWGEQLARDTAPLIGEAAAAELRRRCHAALAYGRATAPAFVLLAMVCESRWLALAGEAQGKADALAEFLDTGGSWPAVIPPEGVTVRAADEAAEPPAKAILKRNEWTGREFKWYWAAAVILLMLYGWAVQVGLL
ncbi:hypothetical protein KL86APRO_10907 [uncultured Alphaproteobacteria bacterium]|uniref:Uncharacterized protein n=1 Tax=uncultured Alphaproteobacteria bacterium TaxID=91750 RepID=A0A212JDX1_9PROT|nr:hypothetical protein KL86APRO_10907 [uncultured Alphaproteobacteria bacterium]